MGDNQDKVVVVTGAGSGIGKATVRRLADEQAKVVAVDLTKASLEWLQDLDSVTSLAGDVTDPQVNEQMVELAVDTYGPLNAAVLNAGILVQGDIVRGSMTDYDRVMDVNVRGVALGLKSAVAAMAPAGGSIAITGSVSGLRGDSGLWAYNVSKGAVVNLARAAALDLGHLNIRVNAVCPGPIHTGLTEDTQGTEIGDAMEARLPLGRFGQPEEVAAVIAFLTSDESSFVTEPSSPWMAESLREPGNGRPMQVENAGTYSYLRVCLCNAASMTQAPISTFPVPELDVIPEDLRSMMLAIQEKTGFIPNVFLGLAHRPDELRAFMAYHDALMERDSGLSKAEREMIVVATSGANSCLYCVVAHGAILRIRAKNPLIADQLAVDPSKADLDDRQKAMIAFAVKLARTPEDLSQSDHQLLRDHGFSDDDIWDIGAITGLFAMSNRLAHLASMRPNDEFFAMGLG